MQFPYIPVVPRHLNISHSSPQLKTQSSSLQWPSSAPKMPRPDSSKASLQFLSWAHAEAVGEWRHVQTVYELCEGFFFFNNQSTLSLYKLINIWHFCFEGKLSEGASEDKAGRFSWRRTGLATAARVARHCAGRPSSEKAAVRSSVVKVFRVTAALIREGPVWMDLAQDGWDR